MQFNEGFRSFIKNSHLIDNKLIIDQKNEADKYYNEQMVDLKLGQFLYPMCRQLSNAVIPLPTLQTTSVPETPVSLAPMSPSGQSLQTQPEFPTSGSFSAAAAAENPAQLMRMKSRNPKPPTSTIQVYNRV